MAFVGLRDVKSMITASDLSGSAYRIVRTVAGRIAGATAGSQVPTGILTEEVADGSVTATEVGVCVSGRTKVRCGGTFADGALLMADADGEAIAATATNYHVARALEDGVDNQIIECVIDIGQLN